MLMVRNQSNFSQSVAFTLGHRQLIAKESVFLVLLEIVIALLVGKSTIYILTGRNGALLVVDDLEAVRRNGPIK